MTRINEVVALHAYIAKQLNKQSHSKSDFIFVLQLFYYSFSDRQMTFETGINKKKKIKQIPTDKTFLSPRHALENMLSALFVGHFLGGAHITLYISLYYICIYMHDPCVQPSVKKGNTEYSSSKLCRSFQLLLVSSFSARVRAVKKTLQNRHDFRLYSLILATKQPALRQLACCLLFVQQCVVVVVHLKSGKYLQQQFCCLRKRGGTKKFFLKPKLFREEAEKSY